MKQINLLSITFLIMIGLGSCSNKSGDQQCKPPKRIDYSISIELGKHKTVKLDSLELKFDFATIYDSLFQVDLIVNQSCPTRFYLLGNKLFQEERKTAETLWIGNFDGIRCFGKQEQYLTKAIDVSHHSTPPKVKKNGTINFYQSGHINKTVLINIELCQPVMGKKLMDLGLEKSENGYRLNLLALKG